jgi:hypothetical protein
MVNVSTNINKPNNYLLPQITENKKTKPTIYDGPILVVEDAGVPGENH